MSKIEKTFVAKAPGTDPLEFVLSDDTVDRYGDVIEPDGWVLTNFRKNPIALFGHSSSFPIGKWSNVRVEGNKLLARLNLAATGTSARIDELINLVEQGILRAVSVGFLPIELEPIDPKKPYEGVRYTKQELLETSLVSVPANPAALVLAKSLHISDETISLAFGEHAETRRRDLTNGGHAATSLAKKAPPKMQTLSQRIEHAQNELVAKRDRLTELNGAEDLDIDAISGLTDEITVAERAVAVLKASEAKIGINAGPTDLASPAVVRRPLSIGQKEVDGFDLLVRSITARGIAHFSNKSIDQVLQERYPGHEATAIVTKADQTIGTTTVSGWASQLVQTVNQGFLQALLPYSIYPALRARGIGFSFDGIGTVSLPSRTAGGAGGGFVAEGSPIRVGRITTAAVTLTPFKLGVIVPFSRELAKRSTPAIEALVRQAILEDTAAILDAAIIDATAASSSRPAGLLNGVSAAASGYGGGDYQAVVADLKALLAPFYSANASDGITVLMNPAQGLALAMMPGPGPSGEFGWAQPLTDRLNIIESTTVPANRLIALRNSDFATAMGDQPEFDVSEQATVHMEDTTPLEIVSGSGPTTADPVRSFFQTATIGVRMLMDISWKMRRSGMVQWIDTTTW
jgi:HK97 family phage major capsid protein/HK97 family phage prohead protease